MTTTTNRPLLLAIALASASLAYAVHAQGPAAAPSDDTVLVHRFTIPERQSWGTISIELTPGAWRVGGLDGAPASEAQLRAALGDVAGIEVGARCAGWVEGPTSYPCGFAVRQIDFAGSVADRYAAIASDWETPDQQRAEAAVKARPAGAGELIAPVLDAPRFVSLRAPLRYLGDKHKTFGGKLQFEIRAVSNPLVPSEFDRGSGMVVLRSGRNSLPI